jgi:dTDP-4-amino-4,6-dideoxygalactose transaminase
MELNMKIPMLDMKRQYKMIKDEIEPKVLAALESGSYILGEQVEAFERELEGYLSVKHAITVANGTDALVIALRAAGVGQGDEVITTPFTFFATAEAIAAIGAIPVFADVCNETYNIDCKSIRQKITRKTKAILPVHIFGQPADMDGIMEIAGENKLIVIEDACQAIGAEYKGKKVGTIGDFGCFSFFPTKNLGAFGDGGLITTNSDKLAIVCRALREHCSGRNGAAAREILEGGEGIQENVKVDPLYNPYKYFNYMIGYNSRLDTLQAVILKVKLKHLDQWNEERTRNADYYIKSLSKSALIMPVVADGVKHIWHQFCLRTTHKHDLGEFLAAKGIASGVFYPVPLHLQKAFDYLGYKAGDLPTAERLTSETLCLPVYPGMTTEELEYIVTAVMEFNN